MISFRDLGLLIIFGLIVGLSIYTFFIFNNLNAILKNIREIQTKHLNDIDQSLSLLPSIVKNIDMAALHVNEGVEKVTEAVDQVGDTISETVLCVGEGTKEAAEYLKIISEIIRVIVSHFRK